MGNLYPARGSDRDCVVFVKQVHFSYSESPWTPPIEWTSLHWRTYSVDLEPVYDLHPITNSPCQRLWHRHNVSSFFFLFSHFCIYLFFLHFFFFFFLLHFFIFCSFFRFFFLFQQVIFLTVNHRGPLPLRELHSTGETIVWRDPGGSWACLRPVYNYEWINSPSQRLTQTLCRFCAAGCFSYGESPRTPPLEGTSLHRRNISVERPWGILSLFTICAQLQVN